MTATRQAACLVYAFAPRNDRQLQADVAFASIECNVPDHLDVYEALDDLVAGVEELEIAAE